MIGPGPPLTLFAAACHGGGDQETTNKRETNVTDRRIGASGASTVAAEGSTVYTSDPAIARAIRDTAVSTAGAMERTAKTSARSARKAAGTAVEEATDTAEKAVEETSDVSKDALDVADKALGLEEREAQIVASAVTGQQVQGEAVKETQQTLRAVAVAGALAVGAGMIFNGR